MRPVICPTCKQPTSLGTDNPWRPFCSERCKLADLGDWFDEEHSVPAEDQAPAQGDWSVPPPHDSGAH